jgi:23S rRNA (pseudouridine1915-N3)-methyltransferase
MRILIAAVGRLKQGPERDLAERYRKRAAESGRAAGIRAIEIVEIRESRAREAAIRVEEESIALANLIPDRAALVVLDVRGSQLDSPAFAARLRHWREENRPAAVLAVGGPDGMTPAMTARAELRLSLGALTLPHQLVRVILLEQVYRATTILSGHPYHRA